MMELGVLVPETREEAKFDITGLYKSLCGGLLLLLVKQYNMTYDETMYVLRESVSSLNEGIALTTIEEENGRI